MDRVNIPGEAPGSATYYMGFAPEEYGARLYEMEHYGDAKIHKALMDIGSQRTEPYKVISSSEEYEDLVWKSKGRTIYSCLFEVTYKDIDIIVKPDFETKRLTLKVDPAIDQKQRSQLAEFFRILTEPDYYEVKELEEIEDELRIPELFRRLAIVALVTMIITAALDLLGIFADMSDMTALKITNTLQFVSVLFMAVYWIWIAVKKRQLKRQREQKRNNEKSTK
jgi:hypothetical protein